MDVVYWLVVVVWYVVYWEVYCCVVVGVVMVVIRGGFVGGDWGEVDCVEVVVCFYWVVVGFVGLWVVVGFVVGDLVVWYVGFVWVFG